MGLRSLDRPGEDMMLADGLTGLGSLDRSEDMMLAGGLAGLASLDRSEGIMLAARIVGLASLDRSGEDIMFAPGCVAARDGLVVGMDSRRSEGTAGAANNSSGGTFSPNVLVSFANCFRRLSRSLALICSEPSDTNGDIDVDALETEVGERGVRGRGVEGVEGADVG